MKTEKDETAVARSIRLPKYVWEALDEDAKRSRRSPVRQLEVILAHYYNIDSDFEVDVGELGNTRAKVSRPDLLGKKLKIIGSGEPNKKN